jgi:hypothetical protein
MLVLLLWPLLLQTQFCALVEAWPTKSLPAIEPVQPHAQLHRR